MGNLIFFKLMYDICYFIVPLFSYIYFQAVVKGAIFARMLPEDKLFLIEHFQNLG